MEYDYKHQNYYVLPSNSSRLKLGPSISSSIIKEVLRPVAIKLASFQLELVQPKILSPSIIHQLLYEADFELRKAIGTVIMRCKTEQIVLKEGFTDAFQSPKQPFDIYDNYFNVQRADVMSSSIFDFEVMRIAQVVITDLMQSQISLEELTSIITGLSLMFTLLIADTGDSMVSDLSETNAVINTTPDLKDTSKYSLHRWKIHHLLFDIAVIFSADDLIQAIDCHYKRDFNQAAIHVDRAGLLLRVSTAAMWAAGTFPAGVYGMIVRPSMVSTQSPGGFSGNMNRDFEHWRVHHEILRTQIAGMIAVPEPLHTATKKMVDLYFQDAEQHILLAAAMVGDQTSLTQYETEKKHRIKYNFGAVEVLRNILQSRKDYWDFLNNKKIY